MKYHKHKSDNTINQTSMLLANFSHKAFLVSGSSSAHFGNETFLSELLEYSKSNPRLFSFAAR